MILSAKLQGIGALADCLSSITDALRSLTERLESIEGLLLVAKKLEVLGSSHVYDRLDKHFGISMGYAKVLCSCLLALFHFLDLRL